MPKTVSIISPCYNGEKYLKRYFDSILAQTYPAIELIFVNDGSVDKTEEIALSYKPLFENRGYCFKYLFQENSGQAAAINQALRCFSGDYLNWMDSDDYLPEDSVSKRVDYLERNQSVGLVIGRTVVVDDKDYKRIGLIDEKSIDRTDAKTLICDFMSGKLGAMPCSTMVRSSMFREAMPDPLQIVAPRIYGQNYQLYIPIMFKYPTRFIPEEVAYYVCHNDSHSHRYRTFEERIQFVDTGFYVLNSIADGLNEDDDLISWFKKAILEYDCKNRLAVMQHYQRKDYLSDVVHSLKNLHRYDLEAKKMVLKIKFPIIKKLSDMRWKYKHKL